MTVVTEKRIIYGLFLVSLIIFVFLTSTYYQIPDNSSSNLDVSPITNMSSHIPFPIQIYTLLLNGSGTTSTILSITRDPNKEAERLQKDVLYGNIKYLMIQGHPYEIKSNNGLKYHIAFLIKNACQVFPFSQCSRNSSITDMKSTIIHALGYNTL